MRCQPVITREITRRQALRRFVAAALLAGCAPRALADIAKEDQLKAVFLMRLAQFVSWPATAFPSPDSPIVIGIVGRDPFGEALDIAVRGETAHNRPIVVQRFRGDAEIAACHILYISRSEAARARALTARVQSRSVLTVSDLEGFVVSDGGMVRFISEQNKIKLRIHAERAQAAQLNVDARLLRMAEVVNR